MMNPYANWPGVNSQIGDIENEMMTVKKWAGVNQLVTASELADNEMPFAQNIQLVEDGYPDKRWGYQKVYGTSLGSGAINGAYDALFNGYIVFAWNTGLYKQTGTSAPTLIYNSLTNYKGYFFTMNDKLYYKNFYEFVEIDSSFNVQAVSTVAYKPTTSIGIPNATGGGTAFEAVNLMSAGRKNSFESDGTAGTTEIVKFLVTHGATSSGNLSLVIDGGTVTVAVLSGDTIYEVARKIRNSTSAVGTFTGERDYAYHTHTATGTKTDATYSTSCGVTITVSTLVQGAATGQMYYLDTQNIDATHCEVVANGLDKVEHTDFEVQRELGIVLMNSAVAAPNPTGIDNVVITFYKTIGNAYQVQTLHVEGGATADADVTITLNGVDKTVAVANGDTASAVATKIRAATFPGWTTGGTSENVTFTSTTYGVKIDAEYNKGTTGAVGYMTLTTAGSDSYQDKIIKTNVKPVLFGGNNDSRVFTAYKNVRYYSGLYDATYWPDINYSKVGNESCNITRFSQLGDTQIIFKERKESEPTIWSSRFELDSSNNPYFPVIPINGVAGCDSYDCCEIVLNNPTFLDKVNGVYTLTYSNVKDQRVVDRLSDRINPTILRENNLNTAVSFLWGHRYGVCVNGNAYVWDYRLNVWYGKWTNINASCFFEIDGSLYFGSDSSGLIYQFRESYHDDGAAIDAYFLTKYHVFSTHNKNKLLSRLYVDLKASERASVTVYYMTDSAVSEKLLHPIENMGLFSYGGIDYSKWTYAASTGFPKAFMRKFREKNFIWVQFRFQNSELGESMPVLSVQYEYTVQQLAKNH